MKSKGQEQIIRKYKSPFTFYTLSIIIPWALWFYSGYLSHQTPYTPLLEWATGITSFAGLLAPVIISLFFILPNKELKKDFFGRIFNFKHIKPQYILIAFFLTLVALLLAQAISLFFGYSANQFELRGTYTFTSAIFPVWFLLIAAPILEELAWHSYGTDCLRSKFNLFNASLLFAIFWAFWHFPLSFIKGYYHSNLVESGAIYSINFVVSLIPFVLIMNWLYYKTNRNILLPIIFHTAAGFFNEIFATHPMSKVIQTGVLIAFTVFLLMKEKEFFFHKKLGKVELPMKGKAFPKKLARKITPVIIGLFLLSQSAYVPAQEITQTIRGKVYDNITNEPLPFATIIVKGSTPVNGAISDIDGNFELKNVKLGRRNLKVTMIGYDAYEVNELLVSSGQAPQLNIGMHPSSVALDEVVVRVRKETSINSMTTLSSRQFTVEETQRYAGGMDDPARLASSFAGVATPSISSNGISVRGNNPDGLLWQIDGVEVPTPNHFANLTIAGGGLLNVISNQVMGNSDFFTGAFPAEYGNASSGVFDIRLKTGNPNERQYSLKAGLLGVGVSAEGPFKNNNDATYLVNYRNSTMALLEPILPDDTGILKYQDLTFKTNFPTKNAGTFTLWGIGALDGQEMEAADSALWESNFDRDNSQTRMYMFATALSHKIGLNKGTFLKTSVSATGNGLEHKEQRMDFALEAHPHSKAANDARQYTIQSSLIKRFSKKHTNKTGMRYSNLHYNIDVEQSMQEGSAPETIAKQTGNSGFLQMFSQSKIQVLPRFTFNIGVNSQCFELNKNVIIEPRAGIKYNINKNQSLGLGYGLHSRLEQLPVYFVSDEGKHPNKNLDFMRSSHYVLSYASKISKNLHLRIEPYYQDLNHVPVSPTDYSSTLNNNNTLFYNEILVSEGKGHNVGVDITFEKFLHRGTYYLLTASLFDSKYTGADGVERNTRFNKNYVFNAIAGKEWELKNNNILSANVRINAMGGNRVEPVDVASSLLKKDVVYGETGNQLAFSKKFKSEPVVSFTFSYRKNKPGYSSVWSLQILNANGAEEFAQDIYSIKTKRIEPVFEGIMLPNLSYKIEF